MFRKLLLTTSTLGAFIPVGVVLSCNDKSADYELLKNFNGFGKLLENESTNNQIHLSKLIKWTDGDTIKFSYEDEFGTTQTKNLRIASIDTPEYHVPGASDPEMRGDINDDELKWAKDGTEWAKKEIPEGSTIKVWNTGLDSYGRVVGSIFYNKENQTDFRNNYSFSIIRSGFTLPRVDKSSDILKAFLKSYTLNHYLFVPLYLAWQEALDKKVRLYSLSSKMLTRVYQKHGIPGNELSRVKLRLKEWMNKDTFKNAKVFK